MSFELQDEPEIIEPWGPERSDGCSILPFLPARLRRRFSEWAVERVVDQPDLVEAACERHDRIYYHGGSRDRRRRADATLRKAWIAAGVPRFVAWLGYRLIRAFGGPGWRRDGVSWAFGGRRFRYSKHPALGIGVDEVPRGARP